MRHVVVIGGGFSGTMVAAQLLRQALAARTSLSVHLIERRSEIGRGAAYATNDPVHLLNVPVSGMSAWPDRPSDFLEWARRRRPEVAPTEFLPRRLYAEYLHETLEHVRNDAGDRARLVVVHDQAERADLRPGGLWEVRLRSGEAIACDGVVLATGHRPPTDPLQGRWSGPRDRWIADPWRPGATDGISSQDAVIIVGAGLTAMDVILSLADRQPGRSGAISLVSRSGLLPRSHLATPSAPVDPMPWLNELALTGRVTRVRDLTRAFRAAVSASRGADWRATIDGLRPYTHGLWAALGDRERRRFLRHVRSFWEVHRHRTAPQIGARIEALETAGFFTRIRGRLRSGQGDLAGLSLQVSATRRGADPVERTVRADWAVNCTGPSPTISHHEDGVAASLIEAGLARMDPIGMGLETDPIGRPIGRSGRASGRLWIIGSLRRPALWETTAVPELRVQAETVARDCLVALA